MIKDTNKRITLTLSQEQLVKLEEIKKLTGCSYSKIISLLILEGCKDV